MMQATNLRYLHHGPQLRRLHGAGGRSILAQRQVSARLLVIFKVAAQNPSQVLLSQHDHVVEAFAPDGADHPLRKRVLPRALGRGEHLGHAHFPHAVPELVAIDSVAVADQVPEYTIFWKRFPNLLSGPFSGRMLGHVEMNQPAPRVSQQHQNEEDAKGRSGHGEEVDRHQLAYVVIEEGLPALRRRSTLSGQESRHGSFRDLDTKLEQLSMDAGRTPQRVSCGHLPDQGSNLGNGFWATAALPSE